MNEPSKSGRKWAYVTILMVIVMVISVLGWQISSLRRNNTALTATNARLAAQYEESLQQPHSCEYGSSGSLADRNAVWRIFNGDAVVPEGTAQHVGAMLAMMLSPKSSDEERGAGMTEYQQRILMYLSQEDVSAISKAFIGDADPKLIADALRRIAIASRVAEEFSLSVLADTDRMERFFTGNLPIPLETMPDGSTP